MSDSKPPPIDLKPVKVERWCDLLEFYHEFDKKHKDSKTEWAFRGQPKACCKLKTTIERVSEKFDIKGKELSDLEDNLLRQFMRRAHHYVADLPKEDDTLEWLALMRHYGAPTRILDWTYSFFTALYFAVEEVEKDKDCALWALDLGWLRPRAESKFRRYVKSIKGKDPNLKSGKFFKRVFKRKPPLKLVYSVNPMRLNERLTLQQGLFLSPGDIREPFMNNFASLLKDNEPIDQYLRKFIVKTSSIEFRKEIIRHLQRMNINRATLFPGLEGFARSLNTASAIREILLKPRRPFSK